MARPAIRRLATALLSAAITQSSASRAGADDTLSGCNEDAMLVFDASGSMASTGHNDPDVPRIIEARNALHSVLPEVSPYRRLGLVTYGPGSRESCGNINLRLKPTVNAADRILAEVDSVQPEGDTPLTRAVALAVDALHGIERPGTVVLVTDGRETCGGDPCALAERLAEDIQAVTVHVIGFKIRGETSDLHGFSDGSFKKTGHTVARCLADRTGGVYASADNTDELISALQQTLGCALLSDSDGTPPKRRSS